MTSVNDREGCPHCDSPGGPKTLRHQVSMPLNGRVQCIDFCIHQIVAALNAGGIITTASCCGHQNMKGTSCLKMGVRSSFSQRQTPMMLGARPLPSNLRDRPWSRRMAPKRATMKKIFDSSKRSCFADRAISPYEAV